MNTLLTKDYHLTKNKSLSCWLMEGTIFKKHTLKKKNCHRLRRFETQKMILIVTL